MFSSISTMIWGEGEQEVPAPAATSTTTTTVRARTPSPSGDDWVLVGASSPAPGDLGALEPLRPGTDSSPPSSAASDVGEEEPRVVTRYGDVRPRVVDRTHPTPADALALEEAKSVKSAQLIKQRNSGKSLSSKALKRSNKTVHAESGKRQSSARINFSIKMAGNRNLKQC